MDSKTIERLLADRGNEYGEAWITTSRVIALLGKEFTDFMAGAPAYVYAWIIIQSKLLRALTSPHKVDHWEDIAGYATLIVNHIHKESSNDNAPADRPLANEESTSSR